MPIDIEVVQNPDQELLDFLDKKIKEFNLKNREPCQRKPLAIQIKNDKGEVIAGAGACTFGNWLLLDTLWVSETLRGQDLGSQILHKLEEAGLQRGCKQCLLNTLDIQAMPFYEKHGYTIQWTQDNYPITGRKYFMIKTLL